MVDSQIRSRGISSPRLLEALRQVPREYFVPGDLADRAYEDQALSIGLEQTGWPEAAPFDKIILTAAPVTLPLTLCDQLKRHGLLIGPSGPSYTQRLTLIEKAEKGIERSDLFPVRFVPLVGESG